MNAEIISIGDELIIGHTINTNATFVADKLTEIGVQVNRITSIGDEREQILEALALAEKRSDIIITSGGLGPTHDDITKAVFVKYFQSTLVLDEKVLEKLRYRFKRRNIKMVKSNEEQAMVPDNAEVVENKIGTAPGLLFRKEGKYFFVLPGVPMELESMTVNFIVPFFREINPIVIKNRIIHTAGIPESTLFQKIGNIEELEKYAKIAFLPHFGMVDIRLTAVCEDEKECWERINKVEQIIEARVGQHIWGKDSIAIENLITSKLIEQQKTIAIAEFGTGGKITATIAKGDRYERFLKQSFVIGSLEQIKKILSISDAPVKSKDLCDKVKIQKFAKQLQKITDADIALVVFYCNNPDSHATMSIADRTNCLAQKVFLPYDQEMNLNRLTSDSLRFVFQNLTDVIHQIQEADRDVVHFN